MLFRSQNPREFEGTYPLPESQLDRFMLRVDIGYPDREAEAQILARYGARLEAAHALPVELAQIDRRLLAAAREEAERVHVSEALGGYVLDLARTSREHARISLGLSTRGALALVKAARIAAAARGSEFVTPDDVKAVAAWVAAHRIVPAPEAALDGTSDLDLIAALLDETPVPR